MRILIKLNKFININLLYLEFGLFIANIEKIFNWGLGMGIGDWGLRFGPST